MCSLCVICFVCISLFNSDSTSMCAQTIFSALDFLTAWVIAKNKAAVVRKSKGLSQKGVYIHTHTRTCV